LVLVSWNLTSQELSGYINNNRNSQAQKNQRRDREIEFKVFPFDPDVAGQTAKPMQLIVEEINNDADKYY